MGEVRPSYDGASHDATASDALPNETAPLAAEQIATVTAVYRRFARSAADSLTTLTRAPAQLRLAAVERLSCRELRSRWAAPAALASVSLDPLPGAALCAVDRSLAFLLIDRMLGGGGAPAVPDRGLSEIEGTVLRRALVALLPDLKRAWAPVCAVAPRLEYLERQADTTDLLAPATRMVCAAFAAAAGERLPAGFAAARHRQAGRLHLAVAEASLAAIGHRLLARELPPRRPARGARADAVLTVELGGAGRHGDGTTIDAGMVIGMGRFAGESVAIEVDRRPVARGQVVALEDSFGIRVTEILGSRRRPG